MFKKLFSNLLYQVASLIVVVLLLGGAIWVYAAFVEPSSAPSASNQDFAQNILGADNTNNTFASTNVAANNEGSIIERLEYLWANRTSFGGSLANLDATVSSRALDSEIGNSGDAASMASTLFGGQQYLWDNKASFGGGLRKYYRSTSAYNGANALTACESGYHMASLPELSPPVNLQYNTTLGLTRDDSGSGPVMGSTYSTGWVRSGYSSFTASGGSVANCAVWTSSDPGHYGQRGYIGVGTGFFVSAQGTCDQSKAVWCVEDY